MLVCVYVRKREKGKDDASKRDNVTMSSLFRCLSLVALEAGGLASVAWLVRVGLGLGCGRG